MAKTFKYYNRQKRKEAEQLQKEFRRITVEKIFKTFPYMESVKEKTEKTVL